MTWALDLDGVVWLGGNSIPGAIEAVRRLQVRGERVVFLTNSSAITLSTYVSKLADMGLAVEPEDVITAAQSAARLLEPGSRAMVLGGAGIVEALGERGVEVADDDGPVDAVIVGFNRTFDFDVLTKVTRAIWAGACLIGTNADTTYPTPEGLLPGTGALLAAVSTAGGKAPIVAGKPHQPMADLVAERVGKVEVMVGDQPETDGRFARLIGARFALVLTGATTEADLPVSPEPDLVAPGLASLVA